MVIVFKSNSKESEKEELKQNLASSGFEPLEYEKDGQLFVEVSGDLSRIDTEMIASMPSVAFIMKKVPSYKLAAKTIDKQKTVIKVKDAVFGDGSCPIIAGPCSVESEEQIVYVAKEVKKKGAKMLRGGAFKPRTSPYSFQGLREEGLRLLSLAKKETGLPIVTELMDLSELHSFSDVDVIQVGARNMMNYEMLKELGKIDKPILLKRGPSATLKEWLMSAEYILSGGNEKVILCERGIRTFETLTRNTLDISAIPLLKEMTHLPIISDPSHGTGIARLVIPMAMASCAAGADGLMVEVHNDPKKAKSDGFQSITPEEFGILAEKVNALLPYSFN